MIKRFFLSAILFSAGILHLVRPELFNAAIPPILGYSKEIILLTGVFEILLALGLIWNKTLDQTAKITAFYFLILIPVHLYVSIQGIEIFGISSKVVLWLRTLFQFFFIFWALSLQTKGWIIEQKWKHVFFLHFKIDPAKIQQLVPFELDLHDGQAVISIVPFYMDGIRFPFLPSIPRVSNLWELNIRTYVKVNGIKGVYFFTLETDSKIAEFVAKIFFHLPYRHSQIDARVSEKEYLFSHKRKDLNFHLEASLSDMKHCSEFDLWATERYSLFTKHNGRIFQGIVQHPPWELKQVKINNMEDQFTKMVTGDLKNLVGASYTEFLLVRFSPFKNISPKGT